MQAHNADGSRSELTNWFFSQRSALNSQLQRSDSALDRRAGPVGLEDVDAGQVRQTRGKRQQIRNGVPCG